MNWVKLTRAYDQQIIYVNLERFDRVEVLTDENNKQVTVLSTTLSVTEEDSVELEVLESPEEFLTGKKS